MTDASQTTASSTPSNDPTDLAPDAAEVIDDALNPPTFDVLPLSAETRAALASMGYTHPTPVQRAVFEPATRGRDLVVQARTGTGKTTAFGLPIIDHLVRRTLKAAQVLALCPTRELALQVSNEIGRLGEGRGVAPIAIYGGAPMGKQIDALAAGAQVVVGTPGRVLDHLRRGTLDASSIRVLVLDEADEMLSMGFERELHAILDLLPKERQTLLFSATLPPDIERMARERLKTPEFVTLSGDAIGALSIAHFVYLITEDKTQSLIKIIEVENPESAIIFCNTKAETESVAQALTRAGFEADWLNGDLDQGEREAVMARTRKGELRYLVATDVAARGIDISLLTHVINYDFPETAEAYVHRTGRTGRAGKTGTAISLLRAQDIGNLYLLRLTYKIRPIERQLPTAGEVKTRHEADLVQMFVDAYADRGAHPDDLALTRRLLSHDRAEAVIAGLLRERLGDRPTSEANASAARRAKGPSPEAEPRQARSRPRGGSNDRGDRSDRRPPSASTDVTSDRGVQGANHRDVQRANDRGVQGASDRSVQGGGERASQGANDRGPRDRTDRGARGSNERNGRGPNESRTASPNDSGGEGASAHMEHGGRERGAQVMGDEAVQGASAERPGPSRRERDGRGPREPRAHDGSGQRAPRAYDRSAPREESATVPNVNDVAMARDARSRDTASVRLEEGAATQREPRVRDVPGPRDREAAAPAETATRELAHAVVGSGAAAVTASAGSEPRRPRTRGRRDDEPDAAASNGEPVRYYVSDTNGAPEPARDMSETRTNRVGSTLADWHPPVEEGDDKPIFSAAAPAASADSEDVRDDDGGPSELDSHNYAEIFVDVGRRDGARPSDFQKILRERGGISRRETGRIRVRDKHAFVSVRRELVERAIEALEGAAIAGRNAHAELAREKPLEAQG